MEDELDLRSQLAEANKLLTLESRRSAELTKTAETLKAEVSRLQQENAAIASGDVKRLQQEFEQRAATAERLTIEGEFKREYLQAGGREDCFSFLWNSHSDRLRIVDGTITAVDEQGIPEYSSNGRIDVRGYVQQLKQASSPTHLFFEPQAAQPEKPSNTKTVPGASLTPTPSGVRQLPRSAMNDPATLRRVAQELGGGDPMALITQGKIQFI